MVEFISFDNNRNRPGSVFPVPVGEKIVLDSLAPPHRMGALGVRQ